MLVLTRKPTEGIHIGDQIVVTILSTGRSNVRIGVDAPPDVSVRRGEVAGVPPQRSIRPPPDTPTAPADIAPHGPPTRTEDETRARHRAARPRICPKCGDVRHVDQKTCGCGLRFYGPPESTEGRGDSP